MRIERFLLGCLISLFLISFVCADDPICTDTDGGVNYGTKGTISFNFQGTKPISTLEEMCWTGVASGTSHNVESCYGSDCTVREYFCTPELNVQSEDYTCPADYACVNGACVAPTCTDSDNGKDYYSLGQGQIVRADGVTIGNDWDSCESETSLEEVFCTSSSTGTSESYNCPEGCLDGICLGERPVCTDTDGGINYLEAGSATDNVLGTINDMCFVQAALFMHMSEAYCSDGVVLEQNHPCKYGCLDQACVGENEDLPCTDSDGMDFFNKGEVTAGIYSKSDVCSEVPGYLFEMTCGNNNFTWEYINCLDNDGKICSDGACVQESCNSLGYINAGRYCGVDGYYHLFKQGGEACDNNFECVNYSCKDGFCQSKYVNVSLNLTEQQSLLQEIWNFILGIECNPLNLSYHCEGDEAFLCGVNGVWESKGIIEGECDVPLNVCGDGNVSGIEQCDDSNLIEEDACLNSCILNICGDTVINSGIEECDDGANGIVGDGCTDTCIAETCLPSEVGTSNCTGYYNTTCEGDFFWHPADNMTLGECGVECLSLWNESCNETTLFVCNDSYVWSNYGLVDGKCGYATPVSSGGGGGGHGGNRINILVYSPLEGVTYGNSIIPLMVDDIKKLANYWTYSLNGAKIIPFTPNASITIAGEGENTLIIYAREEIRSRDASKIVNFNVVFPPASQPGYCGDGICRNTETCESCSLDCGECMIEPALDVCGDGVCGIEESSYSCIDDCIAGKRSIVVAVTTVVVMIGMLGGLGFFLYKKFFEDAFRRWKLLDPRADKVLKA